MEWAYPKRRGLEWRQGWTGRTMASVSSPPLQLLTLFGIVITLLWFSQYKDYKAQLHVAAINFQLFLFLLPVVLMFFVISNSIGGTGRLNFHIPTSQHGSLQRPRVVSPGNLG